MGTVSCWPRRVFGFTGEQSDPTGLQYLRARYLDPTAGTFLSVDPVTPGAGGVVGYNPYTYVGNNPTTWTDPSGEVAITARAGLTAVQRRLLAALIATGLTAFIILAFQQIVDVLDRPNTDTKDDTGDEPGDQPGDEPGPGDRPGPTVPPPPVCVNSLPGGPDIIPGVDIPIIEDCDPRDDEDAELWRGGSRTNANFTPRPPVAGRTDDVVGYPENGLSTFRTKRLACGERNTKAQSLDVALLLAVPGLAMTVDPRDPLHVFLQGDSEELHREWAASRPDAGVSPHRLTVGVQGAWLDESSC